MGIVVHEDSAMFGDLAVQVDVVKRQPGECSEAWKIINLETDGMERLTPKELRQLGRWLIEKGREIGKGYKSNGAPKSAA